MNGFARKIWILSFSGRGLQPQADVRASAGGRGMSSQGGARVQVPLTSSWLSRPKNTDPALSDFLIFFREV